MPYWNTLRQAAPCSTRRNEATMTVDRAWLDGLKPGDKVAMLEGRARGRCWHVLTVVRRTATQIVCRGPSGYEIRARAADGTEVGSRRWEHLELYTDSIRAEIRRARDIAALSAIRWSSLPDETLSAVVALVRPPAPAPGEGG